MNYKKITYSMPPWTSFPHMCDNCGNNIDDNDECYYHGDGVYTCSIECAKEWEGEK